MQIRIKVIPRARKSGITVLADGALKVKLTSAPEKGRANKELIELLADYYKINKSAIKITKGEHSREKIVELKRQN